MPATINRSLFYENDSEFGWGARYYFSYYSERREKGDEHKAIAEVVVIGLLFLCSVISNIALIGTLLSSKSLRTSTNYLIINLGITNILAVAAAPIISVTRISGSWILGSVLCHLSIYETLVCGMVNIWTLVIISVDRRYCVQNQTHIRTRSLIAAVITMWISSACVFLPAGFYFRLKSFSIGEAADFTICTLIWPKTGNLRVSLIFTTTMALVGFCIPLIVLVSQYVLVFAKLRHMSIALMSHVTQQDQRQSLQSSCLQQINTPAPEHLHNTPNIDEHSFTFPPTISTVSEEVDNETQRSNSLNNRPISPRSIFPRPQRSLSTSRSGSAVLRSIGRNYRICLKLVLLVVFFVVLWTPIYIIIGLVVPATDDPSMGFQSHHLLIAIYSLFLHATITPILYGMLNTSLRHKILGKISKIIPCSKNK